MNILYFAWLKEKTGIGHETVSVPEHVGDVRQLIDWLKSRGENFEAAFKDEAVVRVAVNHEHVHLDAPVGDGDEVAFFPPVTGG